MSSNASAGALQNLVTQFATPFDSIRELVQNSIDAGSSNVEVWCNYEYTDEQGVITIHVDDFGEGMDEQIIDNQLTKLFASAKENDLTKIGKFGIGFVSVFALEPRGVLLLTGRGGEYWEVFFHADRSFTKTKIDNPVEGTQITIFLEGSPARYEDVVKEVRGSLKKWCVYAEPEITFENRADETTFEVEVINEDFGVEGLCSIIDVHDDGTEIALAFSVQPQYAFFNRGLTLAMTDDRNHMFPASLYAAVEGLSVQIKSRYLEHTLSRDSVVRDENYDKAMKLFEETLKKLAHTLFTRLEVLAKQGSLNPSEAREYGYLLSESSRFSDEISSEYIKLRFIRVIVGAPVSPRDLLNVFRDTGRIPYAEDPSLMIRRAANVGIPTIWVSPPRLEEQIAELVTLVNLSAPYSLWVFLKKAVGRKVDVLRSTFQLAESLFYDIEILDDNPLQNELLSRSIGLLEAAGVPKVNVKFVNVFPKERGHDTIVFSDLGEFGMEALSKEAKTKSNVVYVNADHDFIYKTIEFAKQDMNLAAFFLSGEIADAVSPTRIGGLLVDAAMRKEGLL